MFVINGHDSLEEVVVEFEWVDWCVRVKGLESTTVCD